MRLDLSYSPKSFQYHLQKASPPHSWIFHEFLRNKTKLINPNLFETNLWTSMHKKNTRSPSFQPCSSNKNPGPIVQFQPVPTEGAQFHLPRTHGLQFRELQFLQRCERWMDGWINFAAVVSSVTNGNLEIFGSGKSPGSQGFNRNVEDFILVDTTCLLYESYLGNCWSNRALSTTNFWNRW